MARLKDKYNSEVKEKLMKELKLDNIYAVPRVIKVAINVGVGEALVNKKAIHNVQEQIELIAGQKSVVTLARKSIAAFKIRKGVPIGVKVTLRGERMYLFLDKLINIVIPRLRDFRGILSKSIDQHGNLNIGFTEQTIFPEIEYDKIDKIRGLEITIVTTAKNIQSGKKLFEMLGIPFNKVN
ncbi:50S ribosomal protein L5 [Candidatus Roizmanbacteria bacterium RIFCSPLOWO2_01_FULL_38_12]|uniref:Large ribosomal subunit protein uL5 n=1 Tax=Candidatus Roizmanbacteria bacterium RIFCSPLOWO2_01_FULL_38_12 TaxID=1802061 RepID=A0A1F7IY08_9BACT|nr:MAG: 50S ribosomal protein L5 [Candidatus Roizmanbacteria bacterium RIFCSPHIGHO2_01_FULL_38_15]OGK35907.1 MAG: 50S ribosomal protein L5 [Candidatus Roizmanbacteria bacterium RIFCSPHIGHO2_12_FULL_38_13]OGK48268.1 MAG: 50S ribosomal protein L5 [Candidatus Roizmanbacteria bacterium RIFCSPLOWO2_01_FULL_38_12]